MWPWANYFISVCLLSAVKWHDDSTYFVRLLWGLNMLVPETVMAHGMCPFRIGSTAPSKKVGALAPTRCWWPGQPCPSSWEPGGLRWTPSYPYTVHSCLGPVGSHFNPLAICPPPSQSLTAALPQTSICKPPLLSMPRAEDPTPHNMPGGRCLNYPEREVRQLTGSNYSGISIFVLSQSTGTQVSILPGNLPVLCHQQLPGLSPLSRSPP